MANFVLVHGAWHGAWCWQRVVPALWQAGHRVHAVTLTGVGERKHLLGPGVTLETHIRDVMNAIEAEELTEVVLVGHSYAGLLITAVADRMAERIRHLVYLDAVVPWPGESWSSQHSPDTVAARLKAATASGGVSLPPPDPGVFGLHGADHAWVTRRQTPHPASVYQAPLQFDPVRVQRLPRTFVDCTEPALATISVMRERVRQEPGWNVVALRTGHDPMISAPQDLIRLLLSLA